MHAIAFTFNRTNRLISHAFDKRTHISIKTQNTKNILPYLNINMY